ncbi:putative ATP-dependent helicase [Hydrogenimonas sp.]|nr:putative ATP-dependent helicase [Hydrogenimonas sp.]
MNDLSYAPGQRALIRDAEWVIRRVDLLADGGYQLTCEGVSNFVKGKEAIFLTSYEKEIKVIDPPKTKLVIDDSSSFERSQLYIESLLRELVPTDDKIYRAHKAAMDVVPYQFDPALQALKQSRQRILMGDAVGLGKTLEAGILVSELMKRGRGKRILVLTVKSMLTQFQKEFWNRFSIPLTRLDSQGIQRVRNRIPANMNPFYYYDKAIISIDTLKQEALYRTYIEEAYWDIIVIDEAHNVADRNSRSRRAELAKLIASRCDSLIMLSATPHDGSAKSFASLLNLLDPTAIADPEHYTADDFKEKGLVIRRFKKDIADQVKEEFKPRKIFVAEGMAKASEAEENAFAILSKIKLRTIDAKKRSGSELFRTTLIKSLMSSPMACSETIEERIKKLQATEGDFEEDIAELEELNSSLAAIGAEEFSKYRKLVDLIKHRIKWKKSVTDDRLVIFTERLATMRFLAEHLKQDLKLNDAQLVTLHGAMPDVEINRIVEDFGQENSKVRVLVATDVASEGINLHYLSHRLFHFDIPWSLMVFQQRNGRIDRYGQEKEPEIYYMQTASRDPEFKGDNRILEILIEKDKQAAENIGDPSAFMNVYDPEKEEAITAEAIAEGKDPEIFSAELDSNAQNSEFDFLALLEERQEKRAETEPEKVFVDMPSLYPDDHHYATAALKYLQKNANGYLEVQYEEDRIRLVAPEDLKYRFKMLPKEIWPKDGYFILSQNRQIIEKEIKESRKNESAWPQIHYLWEQHPVLEWLRDKLLSNFDRLEAPLLRLPTLAATETLFIVSGLIPNKKAQPLIHHWIGVLFVDRRYCKTLSWEEIVAKSGLGRKRFPNPAQPCDTTPYETLLPEVIEAARGYMNEEYRRFDEEATRRLQKRYEELEKLKKRHMKRYNLFHEEELDQSKEGRRIKKIFDDYWRWMEETMILEKEPYIQVVAALIGEQA